MALVSAAEYAASEAAKKAEAAAKAYRASQSGSSSSSSSSSGGGSSSSSKSSSGSNYGTVSAPATAMSSTSTAAAPAAPAAPTYAQQLAQAQAAQAAALKKAQLEAEKKKQAYINTQTGLYNNYFTDQQNSQLTALKNARDTALQGYNSTETTAKQNAYNNSNQVDAQHAQSAQRLKEIMAAQGLLSSGDNITQNIQLENQRQGSLNDINQATSNILQNVTEQRNLVNNQAASQEQSLIDKISADKTNALIQLQQYGDQKETDLTKFNYGTYVDSINQALQQQQQALQSQLAEAQVTGVYNGQQTLDALNSARQDALARANLTGTLDGKSTLAAQAQGFDQSMALADRTGYLGTGNSAVKTLAAQQLDRQNRNDNIALAQWGVENYGYGTPKSDAGVFFDQYNGQKTLNQQNMEFNQGMDSAKLKQAAEQFAQSMGLDYAKLDMQQQSMLMDNAARMAGIDLQRQQFSYDTDPNNINNQYKQAQLNSLNQQDIQGLIEGSSFFRRDEKGNPTGVADKNGLAQYIASLGLPSEQAKQWFIKYGLWSGK